MNQLSDVQKNVIRTAILANQIPNATRGNRLVLRTGQRHFIVLSGPDGVITPHGEYYYHLTGEHHPDQTFDYNQVPIRRGDTEFARDRSGREVRLRTLQANGQYQYTALGRMFFRFRQVEHIVHVPVIIEGTRRNGTPYTREDYLPFDSISVERIMTSAMVTDAQRHARVRAAVLQALSIRQLRGRTVLLEISDETYYYDPTRPWRISSLTTTPHAGAPEAHAALNQPMGALSSSFVPHPDHVIDEAWEVRDDKLCVIRQLSALLKESPRDLIDDFDRLLQRPWQHEGLTPNDVKRFCQERSFPYYCLGSGLMDSWLPALAKGKSLAFATWDGHAYFYKTARVISEWSVSQPSSQRAQLSSEVVSQLPPVSEWSAWDQLPKPGYYHCQDLHQTRKWFLDSGRNPKVTLRGLADWSSLRYACVKAVDGVTGLCIIRELPPDHHEIAAWAARLKVEWCGERLPALTYKALLQLLKVSRRTPSVTEQAEILKRQRGVCSVCKQEFDDNMEWDHEAPLKQLQGNQKQSFRAVCCNCHAEATSHEGGGRALESKFSLRAWESYVMSPRPPTLAWKPHDKGCYTVITTPD